VPQLFVRAYFILAETLTPLQLHVPSQSPGFLVLWASDLTPLVSGLSFSHTWPPGTKIRTCIEPTLVAIKSLHMGYDVTPRYTAHTTEALSTNVRRSVYMEHTMALSLAPLCSAIDRLSRVWPFGIAVPLLTGLHRRVRSHRTGQKTAPHRLQSARHRLGRRTTSAAYRHTWQHIPQRIARRGSTVLASHGS
jgi:hypothetical protein